MNTIYNIFGYEGTPGAAGPKNDPTLDATILKLIKPTTAVPASLKGFGDGLFKGAVAAPYLAKVGLPSNTLDSPAWTSNGNAEKVR